MKWKPRSYKQNENRYKTRFLFFPKKLMGEYRWLEFATWRERYFVNLKRDKFYWTSQYWIDDLNAHGDNLKPSDFLTKILT